MKIPITDILVHERHLVVEAKKAEAGRTPHLEPILMQGGSWLMADSRRLGLVQRAANVFAALASPVLKRIGNWPVPGVNRWLRARDVPLPPKASFRTEWQRTEKGDR